MQSDLPMAALYSTPATKDRTSGDFPTSHIS